MDNQNRTNYDWRPFGLSVPQLLLAGLVISLCGTLFVTGSISTIDFSPYNPDWDGTQEVRELATTNGDIVVATSVDQYTNVDPGSTTAFVLAPESKYTQSERDEIAQFVQTGGTVVIADAYGSRGNTLLDAVGARARFDGRILRDEQNNFQSPFLPVAGDVSSHPLVSGVEGLTFNYGTVISPGTATPLINSSEVSYLVANQNETLTQQTDLRSYPVATVESVGEGSVIAVGDPSIFISSMVDKSGNKAFVSNLINQRSTTLLDRSHNQAPPPLVAATWVLRNHPPIAGGVMAVVIGMLIVGGRSKYRPDHTRIWDELPSAFRQSHTSPFTGTTHSEVASTRQPLISDPDALKTKLKERHPDWDEDQIEHIITGVISKDTDEVDNE